VSDLLLIFDCDPESLAILRSIADRLGCDRVECNSASTLNDILAVQTPTMAVMAVDGAGFNGLAALQALCESNMRPAIFLVGSTAPRVLASARRAAEAKGLKVIGFSARPLEVLAVEAVLCAHMTSAPPIGRAELEMALAGGELTLLYQPKLLLLPAGVTVQGVEALVRWQHPRLGGLRPAHFLGAIAQHGLMTALTDFVMTEAIRQAGQWRRQGMALETVINLAPVLVRDRDFPRRLAWLLQEHDVPAAQVMFDITEPCLHEDRNLVLEVFTSLRILGVGLSLDNFGIGQSSLTELYRMPYSEIKVDQSLLIDGSKDVDAQRIVRAIVELAHALRMTACAQGVETLAMAEFARAAGFDSAQGHFYCAPVDAAHMARFAKLSPSAVADAIEDAEARRLPVGEPSFTGIVRSLRGALR
jgi:EAL domain-containing protein (putative c-di-GMP-specific phosphodiesterase class I)